MQNAQNENPPDNSALLKAENVTDNNNTKVIAYDFNTERGKLMMIQLKSMHQIIFCKMKRILKTVLQVKNRYLFR